MSYIRIKKINSTPYAYLVKSENTAKGPRQKVKQYLGRVYELKKQKEVENVVDCSKNKKELLSGLIANELVSLGFKEKKGGFHSERLHFNSSALSFKKKSSKKNVVLSLNDGYLCNFTLQRILNFKKSKDLNKDAHTLAKYFLEAGLQVSREDFVRFYELI